MKTEVTKTFYDGQKFMELGSFSSLEAAHGAHKHYEFQQTFEDIDTMNTSIPYIHLQVFIDDEHSNDLYFTRKELN